MSLLPKFRPHARLFAAMAVLLAMGARAAPPEDAAQAADPARAFLAENDVAMARMMEAMHAKPSGDVSRDFVAMMAPHHQGAIDMAQAYLRYGQNEQLRRIAQEIIVEQQQEIQAMRMAIGLPPLPPAPVQADSTPAAAADAHAAHAMHQPMHAPSAQPKE